MPLPPQRPPQSAPLYNRIYDALAEHPRANGIRLSLNAEPRRFDNKDGTYSYMKPLCWSLTADGKHIGPDPKLALVGEEHTEAELHQELERYFPGYHSVVDNDIEIGD